MDIEKLLKKLFENIIDEYDEDTIHTPFQLKLFLTKKINHWYKNLDLTHLQASLDKLKDIEKIKQEKDLLRNELLKFSNKKKEKHNIYLFSEYFNIIGLILS